jgi:hypothetical protein
MNIIPKKYIAVFFFPCMAAVSVPASADIWCGSGGCVTVDDCSDRHPSTGTCTATASNKEELNPAGTSGSTLEKTPNNKAKMQALPKVKALKIQE